VPNRSPELSKEAPDTLASKNTHLRFLGVQGAVRDLAHRGQLKTASGLAGAGSSETLVVLVILPLDPAEDNSLTDELLASNPRFQQ